MPKVDDGSTRPVGNATEGEWWDRGYDRRGQNLVCRKCGAVISQLMAYGSDMYWQRHDAWHEVVDGG